jgi:hypothetical protein
VGEEDLAQTRLAVEAKRAELQRTTAQLRDALDIRQRFRENPALFIGVGAAAAFIIAGGPGRIARGVRRQFFPTNPEKAYDSLPKPMQAWVDHMAGAVGPRAGDARQTLSEELQRWRQDPRRNGKISRKLAKQIAEGPPGPQRAAWSAFEVASSIVIAALARKAVERFLSGEPPSGLPALDAVGTAGGAAKPDPKHAKDDVTKPAAERVAASAQYSSLSSRSG